MSEVLGGNYRGRITRMLCFVFATLVVLLDQFIKRWIVLTLALHEDMELIPGIIGLTNVRNTGAAFSILSDQRLLLIGIAILAALLLIAILLRYNDGFWGTLGLAAVLGGTVGNLIDRISYGYVVDMFELQFINFAIFNIADIFITLGGITFMISFIVASIKPEKNDEGIYDDASDGRLTDARVHVEDQIGLYDFQFGEKSQDDAGYEHEGIAGAQHVSDQYIEPEPEPSASYNEPEPYRGAYAYNPQEESTSALDALGELEQELQDAGGLYDTDIDDLLREYGFEDDAD